MDDYLWTTRRAELFVRGLYHIARCDGLHLKERGAIELFMKKTNVVLDLDALEEEPFDYELAARALESTWLRKVFVQACRIMVQIDGRITRRERDALRAMAVAMGIGESNALSKVEDVRATPAQLIDWVDGLEVDFVSWDDHHQPGYFWEFPHPNRLIATHAVFHVYEGQSLVISHQDKVTDVLAPGTYYARPDTLPVFAREAGWNGEPVHMDLVFVRTAPSPGMRWGLSNGVELITPRLGEFTLRAYGRCAVRVHDSALVKARMTGLGIPTDAEVEQRVGRMVAGRLAKSLQDASGGEPDLATYLEDLDALRDRVAPMLREQFKSSGLTLNRFSIENVTLPLEMGIQPRSLRAEKLMRVGQQVLGSISRDSANLEAEDVFGDLTQSSLGGDLQMRETSADFSPESMRSDETGPPSYLECHLCGGPVSPGAAFCPSCGVAQRLPCTQCGAPVTRGATFCGQCGMNCRQNDESS